MVPELMLQVGNQRTVPDVAWCAAQFWLVTILFFRTDLIYFLEMQAAIEIRSNFWNAHKNMK
jgi:hypothetical protein